LTSALTGKRRTIKDNERLIMSAMKCVVIGDSNIGKTSMLSRFCRDVFPERHIPTVFDDYTGKNSLTNVFFSSSIVAFLVMMYVGETVLVREVKG
jgi:GTPase SAR1 family protein